MQGSCKSAAELDGVGTTLRPELALSGEGKQDDKAVLVGPARGNSRGMLAEERGGAWQPGCTSKSRLPDSAPCCTAGNISDEPGAIGLREGVGPNWAALSAARCWRPKNRFSEVMMPFSFFFERKSVETEFTMHDDSPDSARLCSGIMLRQFYKQISSFCVVSALAFHHM